MAGDGLDMKVLKAIHVLSTCGSVTRAAEILQVTPGAVSYLINKARKTTGSALFFRTRTGMEPNTLAKELSQRYQNINHELNASDSNNAYASRSIVVSTYSLAELILSHAALNSASTLPMLHFQPQHESENERLIKLRNKEVDIDIGTRLPVDRSIVQIKFIVSDTGVLLSKEHPTIKDSITLEQWQNSRHAIWARGMYFFSDDITKTNQFNELFRDQSLSLVASSSLSVATLCALSDLVILMPKIVGNKLEKILPVKWLPAPDELTMHYECFLHYHHSHADNNNLSELITFFQQAFN
ncbi:LysR family transcriptional regulator [Scandinavium sp. NPDC088450]|uniref:LysR family transcriptional regulator n=1 Tax=Scandinavium sp. NPDC088450 TaxID=3364514 RepID=UPI00385140B7